jgi:phage tail sheath gpL-like
MRDTAPAITLGELAAAYAATLAGNALPFNPVNNLVLGEIAAPVTETDYLTIGAGLESETALAKGWTPLRVKSNGEVAVVRSITTRITTNGTTRVQSYFDVQDFQVLYYWRKTLWTRFSQPDFMNAKRSVKIARAIKGEMLRLAKLFEDQAMFQSVKELASQFTVVTSSTDRNRLDVTTPVNVIPGLHVIASTIKASTQFDTITV